MGASGALDPRATTTQGWTRTSLARSKRSPKRSPLDTAHWRSLERFARTLSSLPDLPPALSEMDRRRRVGKRPSSSGTRPQGAWRDRPLGVLHRRHFCGGQKGGRCVGKTKRGKGTKIMAVADGSSVPLSIHTASASPHELTLVGETLAEGFVGETPEKLIGDRAYDSDPLDAELGAMDIEMIAPSSAKTARRERPKMGASSDATRGVGR
jgi:hypothetical protein